MENTKDRITSIPMKQERNICIPRKTFRSAYAEHIILSKQLTNKRESIVDWWSVINNALVPLGILWMAIECCL